MEIKDLAGLSEPATQLINWVGNAIGTLYEPTRIRLEAKAKGEAAIIEAKATLEIDGLQRRAAERVEIREVRRQRNLENIMANAAQEVSPDSNSIPPSEDWFAEFLNNCQDVGDNEMQQLWARVLVGEFSRPGAYSLRALNSLKLLTRQEAELFSRFCRFLWRTEEEFPVVYLKSAQVDHSPKQREYLNKSVIILQTLGLVYGLNDMHISFKRTGKILDFHGRKYRIRFVKGAGPYTYPCIALTSVGVELFKLCYGNGDTHYLQKYLDEHERLTTHALYNYTEIVPA